MARYKPGQGWLPESLFGPGERIEQPEPARGRLADPDARLRGRRSRRNVALAWGNGPVGTRPGDAAELPRQPLRDRLRSRRTRRAATRSAPQAVGHGGVLLRYGKTWTPETELPAEAQNAQFTGIAFAGSEALVAYNVQRNPQGTAVQRRPARQRRQRLADRPGRAAGDRLGARAGRRRPARRRRGGAGGRRRTRVAPVRARIGRGPVAAEATPLPSGARGLAGALSAKAARCARCSPPAARGGVTKAIPSEPPPGFPPYEQQRRRRRGGGAEAGAMLRQTATGWRDERHDINPVKQGRSYSEYDAPSHPDPAVAALVSRRTARKPGSSAASPSEDEREQTADVARYPAGAAPRTRAAAKVPVESEAPGPGGTRRRDDDRARRLGQLRDPVRRSRRHRRRGRRSG